MFLSFGMKNRIEKEEKSYEPKTSPKKSAIHQKCKELTKDKNEAKMIETCTLHEVAALLGC